MDLLLFSIMCDFDIVFVCFFILVGCIYNENEVLLREYRPYIPACRHETSI